MKEEFSASVCCSWDAVRMTAENGVKAADGADGADGAEGAEGAEGVDGVGLDASKTDLRGAEGSGREQAGSTEPPTRAHLTT
ncbi:hypothetical protein [Streptomyces sp. NPDC015125]|uniref:hypothetical protein n=1 Tax=Streptomyces sp. NPDC015125 TaxID=3364938 RepID=UPI0036FC6F4B